jgi:hypothetical protein
MPSRAAWKPVDDWTVVTGLKVEVWDRDRLLDQGIVDAVTADGAILWLKHHGVLHRRVVEKVDDRHIRVVLSAHNVPPPAQDGKPGFQPVSPNAMPSAAEDKAAGQPFSRANPRP